MFRQLLKGPQGGSGARTIFLSPHRPSRGAETWELLHNPNGPSPGAQMNAACHLNYDGLLAGQIDVQRQVQPYL